VHQVGHLFRCKRLRIRIGQPKALFGLFAQFIQRVVLVVLGSVDQVSPRLGIG